MVYYHLPGLFEFYEFYRVFLPLFRTHREYFYDWCDIGSIYGAPADCLWGGGRVGFGEADPRRVLELTQAYGISARLTLSNSLLRREHLTDRKCNRLCEQFSQSGKNGVILHSDLLLGYLRQQYPGFYFVSSTTKVLTDFRQLEEELNRAGTDAELDEIRQELQARLQAEGSQALYAELAAVDPGYAAKVHPNNTPRVIRALELYRATGRKMSAEREAARPAEKPYRSLCLCLTCRDRTLLYQRIDTRCDRMMQSGILEEAKLVYDHRDTYRTAAQAIGYKEFFPYFEGTADLESCLAHLKQASRNYAKRQLTWFRRQTDAVWLYLEDGNLEQQAAEQTEAFLAENNA